MIEKIPFGRTGHLSTRTIFGAAALSQVTQAEADHTLEILLQYGVNHLDTAASYGDSELRLMPWLARYRSDFFLATKTGQRTYQQARDELRRSLDRLGVEQVDLLQLHNLVDPQEWAVAMGPGGALEAAVEARQEGLVRFIGVTGHGTTVAEMHRRALEQFDFDSVLLPYNYSMMQNPQYAADFERLLALCQERHVAVQTIKSITRGPWGEKAPNYATWYEPLEDQAEIDQAVQWVLSRPHLFLNTVGDIHLLPKVLDAAGRFQAGLPVEQTEAKLAAIEMKPLFV
ncbi:MAG: aldo/keto reductase [Chloroflexi bacterium]|nr:aldo/keto reductase [Chloroflexota bacterium]MCI0575297.1 aldo/keto reductase [Chloroflexota bacterium]